ncbi:MAG: hypothetical protein GY731_01655 [Gammaproteobacteria bacterium]|nr:hypothetical protein [Gammaproteobacteria bacterium]
MKSQPTTLSRFLANTAALGLLGLLVFTVWEKRYLPPEIGIPDQGGPTAKTISLPTATNGTPAPERIAQWHLFGQQQSLREVVKPAPVKAPETKLNLTLRGVLSSDDTENARAIITNPKGEEKLYRVGEKLPGGAKLAEIHANNVLLRRNDRLETLLLAKDLLPSKTPESRSRPQRSVRPRTKRSPRRSSQIRPRRARTGSGADPSK